VSTSISVLISLVSLNPAFITEYANYTAEDLTFISKHSKDILVVSGNIDETPNVNLSFLSSVSELIISIVAGSIRF
jgi:hypothetical protein